MQQQQHSTEPHLVFEPKNLLRYDFDARRYRQGSVVFHAGDSLEIEVAPGIWLPVHVHSGSSYSEDGWIFKTTTGIDILPKEGLAVRHHKNQSTYF